MDIKDVKIKEEVVFEEEKFYIESFPNEDFGSIRNFEQNKIAVYMKEELKDDYENEMISMYPQFDSNPSSSFDSSNQTKNTESLENEDVEFENNSSVSQQLLSECELCQKKLKRKSLYSHMKQVHALVKETFKCNVCAKMFKSNIHLKHHENTHSKQFECSFCGKKFSQKFELGNHITRQHENPGSFECKVCWKKFNLKKILRSHEKTHDKNRQKSYRCDFCEYSTDNSHHLIRHQETHRHKKVINFISLQVKTEN